MNELNDTYERARRDTGLTHHELWLRYFALGGMRSAFELGPLKKPSGGHALLHAKSMPSRATFRLRSAFRPL